MDGQSIFWGTIISLLFIFVPGYALSLAIFPKRNDVSIVERIGLSAILGVIPHLIIYFINKNAGIAITSLTSYLVIILVTVSALAYWSRFQNTPSKA
ncbi:MAG: DUF1616 domain-containing protein [Candidatus Altiarchaeota archaeon]